MKWSMCILVPGLFPLPKLAPPSPTVARQRRHKTVRRVRFRASRSLFPVSIGSRAHWALPSWLGNGDPGWVVSRVCLSLRISDPLLWLAVPGPRMHPCALILSCISDTDIRLAVCLSVESLEGHYISPNGKVMILKQAIWALSLWPLALSSPRSAPLLPQSEVEKYSYFNNPAKAPSDIFPTSDAAIRSRIDVWVVNTSNYYPRSSADFSGQVDSGGLSSTRDNINEVPQYPTFGSLEALMLWGSKEKLPYPLRYWRNVMSYSNRQLISNGNSVLVSARKDTKNEPCSDFSQAILQWSLYFWWYCYWGWSP